MVVIPVHLRFTILLGLEVRLQLPKDPDHPSAWVHLCRKWYLLLYIRSELNEVPPISSTLDTSQVNAINP
jgi:hypothetical protein